MQWLHHSSMLAGMVTPSPAVITVLITPELVEGINSIKDMPL